MKLIAIAGMHRSGTSFVAELLSAMGAELGQSLLQSAQDNPHGFFENQPAKELNDTILRRLGGTWDRPPVGLSDRWQSSSSLDPIRQSAEAVIATLAEEASGAPAAVIKDPRLSLTLPFWKSVVSIDHVVIPLRAPVEVAQSLRHRNGFSAERSSTLWIRYTVDALLSAIDPVLVPFGLLLDKPAEGISRLATTLGLEDGVGAAVSMSEGRTRTWKPAAHFTNVPACEQLRFATSLFSVLVKAESMEAVRPLLETIASNWQLGTSSSSMWFPDTSIQVTNADTNSGRYQKLQLEQEELTLRARGLEEENAVTRRELRVMTEQLTEKTSALEEAQRDLIHANDRYVQVAADLGHEHEHVVELRAKLDEQVSQSADEQQRRAAAEQEARKATEKAETAEQEARKATEKAETAEQAEREATRRAESDTRRARAAERNFQRLKSRRSVRLAILAARPFRPLFRGARRVRSRRRTSQRSPSKISRQDPAPLANDNEIQRTRKKFPIGLDSATRKTLRHRIAEQPDLKEILVSIVMPSYNRAGQIHHAIESVIAQTHPSWELLVIDDGSDDDTPTVMAGFVARDKRIRYIENPRGGVSAARNAALEISTGEIIAFLDTDNSWDPEFLALMVAELDRSGADIAYSAMRSVRDGKVVSYRGDRFDLDAMRRGNYVDLNVVCHRRQLVDEGARFDSCLRRMVDWDYLLRTARDRKVTYAPFLGGTYTLHQEDDQISNREPYLYRRVVASRHQSGNVEDANRDAVRIFRELELDIAICVAAPHSKRNEWGDYHFGTGLAQAFERQGHRTTLYYFEETVERPHDLVISLRGLTGHTPPDNSFHIIWSISHPDLLSWEEIERCDLFFSASLTWPEMLDWIVSTPHFALPQATDRTRFHPHTNADQGHEVLFVGNSRDTERPIVTQAAASGLPLSVFGTRWKGRIPDSMIKGEHIPNEDLTHAYGSAGVVLNDHWESMRDYGYVSNRVFDVVASGGRLLSDDLASLRRIFGNAVTAVSPHDDLEAAITRASASSNTTTDAFWVLDHHTFDRRASQVLERIEDFLFCVGEDTSLEPDLEDDAEVNRPGMIVLRGKSERLRIAVAPQTTHSGFTSSAYIRLVQPLTSEIPGYEIKLSRVDTSGSPSAISQLAGADAFVVSRTALTDPIIASEWLDAAESLSIPVVLDVDDAFHRMDETHPEYELYEERIDALMLVMQRAAEIWASTQPLASSIAAFSPNVRVVPNSIDPRLWRRYRPLDPPPSRSGDHGLEVLYSGSATHGADLESILPALDELADRARFRLTVVGVAPQIAKRPWIRRMAPALGGQYPRYATWIRDVAPLFDVGIAPLVDNEFNGFKSDVKLLEYLALGLVPVASEVGPYAASRDLAVGGTLSSSSEWVDRLASLATKPDERRQASRRAGVASQTVWTSRSAAGVGAVLADCLRDLAAQ